MITLKPLWATSALSLVIATASLSGFGAPETPPPSGLLFAAREDARFALPQHAIDGRSRAVSINRDLLRRGRFFVELPDGVSFEAVRDIQYDLGDGRFAWVGHASGSTRDRVVIGNSGDALAATFRVSGRLFKLEPRPNGDHVVSEVNTSDPAPEHDPVAVRDVVAASVSPAEGATAGAGAPIIDVLVAYTPRIASIYGTPGAEALIIQAVAETNQAYANSGIDTRLNLVHIAATDYVESGNIDTDLDRLRDSTDGYMDELHTARDSYGADLVSLIEDEPAYCGVAYRMATLSTSFASSAFSVVHGNCATGYYSFGHELGHNQGAHHDQANGSGALYPYAYGYQDPYETFRTVMAYNCNRNCTRVDHFSNPDNLYAGQPIGIAGYADNSRAIDNTAATVAGFRTAGSQPAPPATPGSLSAAATGPTTIELHWTDKATDESGFSVERSDDGVTFTEVASLPANSTGYLDDDLAPAKLYNYRARSWNSAGYSNYTNVATAATEAAPAYIEQLATADVSTTGTLSGTYQDTWFADGVYESISEQNLVHRITGQQFSFLKHTWAFDVAPGTSTVVLADARTDASTDSFAFAYSTDNITWVNMFMVDDQTAGELQFTLPAGVSGTVYIRVYDRVRKVSAPTDHSVRIDHLVIRTE